MIKVFIYKGGGYLELKKLCIFLLFFIILLLIVNYRDSMSIKAYKLDILERKVKSEATYPDIYNYLSSVTLKKFEEMVAQKESVVIYIGRPTCSDCNAFETEFIKILQKNKLENIVYLNVTKLRNSDRKWQIFQDTYDVQYTPTIVKFENGKNISKVEWSPQKGTDLIAFEKWIDRYAK